MKQPIYIIIVVLALSCNQQNDKMKKIQATIDSLQKQLSQTYKPGFGEFMSSIQMHHAKLWFAGINNNWDLADFEIHEIEESLEDIEQFNSDRPESKNIKMISPAIDSVSHAIEQKDGQRFKNSFTFLTNTCNNCHKETEHAFNVVTIPTEIPVVNQDFKPAK